MISHISQNKFPRRAMILAAGRGKRLRPLTDKTPKSLVDVGGVPLIEYHLKKFADMGVQDVVINHAWLGQDIEKTVGSGERFGLNIHFSPEPEGALETAGGILNAMPMLTDGKEPFLVVNGDVYTDMAFLDLYRLTLKKDVLAHLVMVPTPEFKEKGDFGLKNGFLTDEPEYTFSGISVLHPDLFNGWTEGHLPLAPVLKRAISVGRITGELFEGYWNDVGTLERLEQARQHFEIEV